MSGYKKMTLASFIEKLQAGTYEGIAGARRAAGRTDWKDKDKQAAQRAIDAYFDTDKKKAEAGESAPAPSPPAVTPDAVVNTVNSAFVGLQAAKNLEVPAATVASAAEAGVRLLTSSLRSLEESLKDHPGFSSS